MSAEHDDRPELPPPLARGIQTWVKNHRRDDFLELEEGELRSFWFKEFHPELSDGGLDPDSRAAYETIVAYRLTRMVAILRELMPADGALADIEAHPSEGDPWTLWWAPHAVRPLGNDRSIRTAAEAVRMAPGVPLLPPAPSPDGVDEALDHWFTGMALVAKMLGMVSHGVSRRAIDRLLTARWVHEAWPDQEALIKFEQVLLRDTYQMVVDTGDAAAQAALESQYGFDVREARAVVAAARSQATRERETNLNEERAIMLARLDAQYRQAQQAMDLKASRNALKDIALVLGLTRSAPEDIIHAMTTTLKKLSDSTANGEKGPVQLLKDPDFRALDVPEEFRRPNGPSEALLRIQSHIKEAENETSGDD